MLYNEVRSVRHLLVGGVQRLIANTMVTVKCRVRFKDYIMDIIDKIYWILITAGLCGCSFAIGVNTGKQKMRDLFRKKLEELHKKNKENKDG